MVAWGWLYPVADLFKNNLTFDNDFRPLDLQVGDHVNLNIAFEDHSVTVTNQRNGVSSVASLQKAATILCQRNVAWIVGRTDNNDPASFEGGAFTFTNVTASTLQGGPLGLQGADSVTGSQSVKCSVDAGVVTCSNS